MKTLNRHFIVLPLILLGCSTTPKILSPLPEESVVARIKNDVKTGVDSSPVKTSSEARAKMYLEAKKFEAEGNKTEACSRFEFLSKDNEFALKDVSLIHSMLNCDYTTNKLITIWDRSDIPNYAKEQYLRLSLYLAHLKKQLKYAADFSYELVNYQAVQYEKVNLLKNAIKIAEDIKDSKRREKFFSRLVEVSPLYSKEISNFNKYAVARDFEKNRNFERARELYQQIYNDNSFAFEDQVKAFNNYRTTFKLERKLQEFLNQTYQMEKWIKQKLDTNPTDAIRSQWIETNIALARAVWTENQRDEARKILNNALSSKLADGNQTASLYWVHGGISVEEKNYQAAIEYYTKGNQQKITDMAMRENLQWAIFWNLYLSKQYKKAIEVADGFIKSSNNQVFINRLMFWSAKSEELRKNDFEYNEKLKDLADSDPFGYYGILAHMELELPMKKLDRHQYREIKSGNLTLDWLMAMEETDLARNLLKEIDSTFKTPEQRENALLLYVQTGWYQGALRQINNFSSSKRLELTEKYPDIIYPTGFEKEADEASKKFSTISKDFIWSIIRQESTFDQYARSWADAFGLMQILPEKAKALSTKYEIPYHEMSDLYLPSTNLQMGSALLKEAKEKFKGHFVQSVASYNAAESAVRNWEKERFNGNYLEFIELIPYEETRNYVKLVFRNFITYKRIESSQDLVIEKNFFENDFF